MCKKAVEEDTNMLKYVPDQYITQEMCNEAHGSPWLIGHVPDCFKTQGMCDAIVCLEPLLLAYVPYYLKI